MSPQGEVRWSLPGWRDGGIWVELLELDGVPTVEFTQEDYIVGLPLMIWPQVVECVERLRSLADEAKR
jgi:hypothetical protein